MTYTRTTIQDFLASVPPFDQLPPAALQDLSQKVKLLRYRMGQAICVRHKMPDQVAIVYEGQARLLGHDPRTDKPITLQLLQPGAVLGWVGLVRGVACETAIASTETICLVLPALEFLTMIQGDTAIANALHNKCSLIEVFDLLGEEIHRRAIGNVDLKELALRAQKTASIKRVPPGPVTPTVVDSKHLWLVSGGGAITNTPVGSYLQPEDASLPLQQRQVTGSYPARLIGIRKEVLQNAPTRATVAATETDDVTTITEGIGTNQDNGVPAGAFSPPNGLDIADAPDRPTEFKQPIYVTEQTKSKSPSDFPYVRGKGDVDGTIACFQMIAKHLNLPFRRDNIQRILTAQVARIGGASLELCGAVSELMGLQAQLATVPVSALGRLEVPALIHWNDSIVVLYDVNEQSVIVGSPEMGVFQRPTEEFARTWGEPQEDGSLRAQILLVKRTENTPQKRFGLSWFLPSLRKYRRVLIEVFIASFFVQLFALANPLMVQVIIDRVINQNSADTLQVLGSILLVIAIFEAVLTSLRTYLFVDTTNRIDMALGSEIIDHLLRLPLRYFERRPVGELSTRINELENIRSFLTGTALTVVLDAVFSVIYIGVMFIYSWVLTLVSLATIPLFVALAFVASPLIRRQLRVKAERNAETQSYLVEVMSGIQTVKAQNMELRSRWQWQKRYARYVSAGFKTVLTSTAASSTSNFLNKLSGLLVLWVGAYLVLQGELTLGQLIAFRIISGYVTSPLLRLAQLWQNFQETALSIERLSDIVDAAPEATDEDRKNIPMPEVKGRVQYDNVTFRFGTSGPPQLNNISIEFEPGTYVGIVGLSGSGKSTFTKLLPRLYNLESGRILVDGYDISKVELYSLRQQIGIVPQDSLLFEGTIQENIALTLPDASADQIIEAAKVAAAHDFIMELPNGYNSRVGERGASLSGGQRQRIAIARTILQNPRMLILDEATSALDYDTERRVSINLSEVYEGRTVFFITHRLSTIRNADTIIMMDKGSIVEQGTHDELMDLQGRYYCLFQQQEAQL
ncbi:MAG: type I secretion system permease/ATPase [Cyanothece sp. SIO2G6]|nr:type I secretion system permease/ATPase [Cyanothece sp. SIO2G6]